MSFLQLVLSLDKTIRELILFCRQCHSDPYRNKKDSREMNSSKEWKVCLRFMPEKLTAHFLPHNVLQYAK